MTGCPWHMTRFMRATCVNILLPMMVLIMRIKAIRAFVRPFVNWRDRQSQHSTTRILFVPHMYTRLVSRGAQHSRKKWQSKVQASKGAPEVLRDFDGKGVNDEDGDDSAARSNSAAIGFTADRIVPIELQSELSSSFMQYAMSTILGRALPDARDGLKPVHRRILYAMHVLNLQPEYSYRKCARVVGEVLGKYHPHGDTSVYDALVRMAQDFVMGAPLIAGHGNFGSIDDDPAAAMRYTECKLSALARDTLLSDIGQDTVDFTPNFDGNEVEPLVLPARVPMLLLNGATGIAVGMATNVPPHNLGELIRGVLALIDEPALPDEKLLRLIPAPDFPSGGEILGLEGARKLYTQGVGSVVMRGKTHMEAISFAGGRQVRNAIVVTELPYQVNKAALLERIADMVNAKKLDGIADLRDESDREGVRVVIELKRDAVPNIVENNLFIRTPLQTSFPGNFLALSSDGTQPQRLSLRAALQTFIHFRFKTIRRRSQYELNKVDSRDHVVDGLIRALNQIDDVVSLIRQAKDAPAAKAVLMTPQYAMSEAQANAILALTLGRLTALESSKLQGERQELQIRIKSLREIMQQDDKVLAIMKKELQDIRTKHAVPRRTVLKADPGTLTELDLLANDRSVMIVTAAGYIKRMPIGEFESQGRGGRGKLGARMAADDMVQNLFACNDHDYLVFISEKGIAYGVRAFQVPQASRSSKGVPLPQVLPLSSDDRISGVIPLEDAPRSDGFLLLLTKGGFIKKTPEKAFLKISSRGLTAVNLESDDRVGWVRSCIDADDILIATRQGRASRSSSAKLRSTSRSSRGSRAIKLKPDDEVVDVTILPPDSSGGNRRGKASPRKSYLLVVTTAGFGKRVLASTFMVHGRVSIGVTAIKFKPGIDDALACLRACGDEDEVVLSTQKGTIVRQAVSDISMQSRTATGVRVQRLDEGNRILDVAIVPKESAETTSEAKDLGAATKRIRHSTSTDTDEFDDLDKAS